MCASKSGVNKIVRVIDGEVLVNLGVQEVIARPAAACDGHAWVNVVL